MSSERKHRITISLTAEEYAVLKRMNTLNGVPMSRTVAELVSAVTPVLGRMADNLEKVKVADEKIKQQLRESADRSLDALEVLRSEAMGHFDNFSADLDTVLGDLVGGGDARRQADADGRNASAVPPSSNTGVRYAKSKKGR